MKLITRDTDYAIRAIAALAGRKGEVVPVTELVGVLKVPRPFLRKILQRLNARGILSSTKGKGGGFRLKGDPGTIRITDLIEIFQGPVRLNECFFRKSLCPNRRSCPLKKKIDAIERYVAGELSTITVRSIMPG